MAAGGFLAYLLLASDPTNAQSNEAESQVPLAPVEVDSEAFGQAISMLRCVRAAQSEYREELRALASEEARQEQLNKICEITRRNSEIVKQLRIAHPDASDEELSEEHKNIVLLAAFYRSPDDEAGAKND